MPYRTSSTIGRQRTTRWSLVASPSNCVHSSMMLSTWVPGISWEQYALGLQRNCWPWIKDSWAGLRAYNDIGKKTWLPEAVHCAGPKFIPYFIQMSLSHTLASLLPHLPEGAIEGKKVMLIWNWFSLPGSTPADLSSVERGHGMWLLSLQHRDPGMPGAWSQEPKGSETWTSQNSTCSLHMLSSLQNMEFLSWRDLTSEMLAYSAPAGICNFSVFEPWIWIISVSLSSSLRTWTFILWWQGQHLTHMPLSHKDINTGAPHILGLEPMLMVGTWLEELVEQEPIKHLLKVNISQQKPSPSCL